MLDARFPTLSCEAKAGNTRQVAGCFGLSDWRRCARTEVVFWLQSRRLFWHRAATRSSCRKRLGFVASAVSVRLAVLFTFLLTTVLLLRSEFPLLQKPK